MDVAMIYKRLEELRIPFQLHEHGAVRTCEEAERERRGAEYGGCKCLMVANKDDKSFYLIVMPAEKRLNIKQLMNDLRETKLHFASRDQLQEVLRVYPGAVSVLGVIFDSGKRVRVVLDCDLWKRETWGVHPNVNTKTLALSADHITSYVEASGHEAIKLSL